MRHRPADVIEERRGVGPVRANRFDWLRGAERADAAGEHVGIGAVALRAMTDQTLRLIHRFAGFDGAGTVGQRGAVGSDGDVHLLHDRFRRFPPEVWGHRPLVGHGGCGRSLGKQQSCHDDGSGHRLRETRGRR